MESDSRAPIASERTVGIEKDKKCARSMSGSRLCGNEVAAMEDGLIREIPLRRVGRPSDIADAIVFLASDQARWITGQLLCVHGGHRMSLGV